MIIWKNVNTYPISLSPGSGCSLKIPAARPARWANTAAVWCEGEGAMVGTQAEDGEGARDVRRQGWSCVRARACATHPRTLVCAHARTHACTVCVFVCVYVCVCVCVYEREWPSWSLYGLGLRVCWGSGTGPGEVGLSWGASGTSRNKLPSSGTTANW